MSSTRTSDLSAAYADAVAAVTESRLAHGEAAAAEQELRRAHEATAEAARRALVEGREHVPDGLIVRAQGRFEDAKARIRDLRAAELERWRALANAARGLEPDMAAEQLRALMTDGEAMLSLAADQVTAARENLEHIVQLAAWLQSGADLPPRLGVGVAGLAAAPTLRDPAGELYTWSQVDAATRSFPEAARRLLEQVLRPLPERPPTESDWAIEMLEWYVAAGGSASDSIADIRAAYLEHGPRRREAQRDLAQITMQATRDQRTWVS